MNTQQAVIGGGGGAGFGYISTQISDAIGVGYLNGRTDGLIVVFLGKEQALLNQVELRRFIELLQMIEKAEKFKQLVKKRETKKTKKRRK